MNVNEHVEMVEPPVKLLAENTTAAAVSSAQFAAIVIAEPDAKELVGLKLQVIQAIAKRKYTQIIPLLERVLEKQREFLGQTHPEIADTLCDLASWHKLFGDYSIAHKLYSQSMEMKELALGAEHPSIAVILTHLAALHTEHGNYDLAEALFKRVLAIDRQLFSAEHPLVASNLHRYAALLRKAGRHEEATQINDQANAIRATLNNNASCSRCG